MITPECIHIRIRDLRRERALTQEALAEALGLSRQSVNAMEAGRNLPSLPVALEIASFFAVPLHVLFEVKSGQAQDAGSEDNDVSLDNVVQDSTRNQGKENHMVQIVPWSPLREMREMLDDMMDETANWSPALPIAAPAVNIHQDEKNVTAEMRLPGFKKEDLSIEVGEDFLTVTGEVKKEEEEKKDSAPQYFRREFITQSFSRSVSLPAQVQIDKAEAEMNHGVLKVVMPKVVEEKPKTSKIQIKA